MMMMMMYTFALLVTEGLYWTNYWERYRHVSDNDVSYDDYDYYDEDQVVVRPSFVQTARNISVLRGQTASLCCQVEHLGLKTVQTCFNQ